MSDEIIFHSPTRGLLGLAGVVADIADYVRLEPNRIYEITIGTDSPASGEVELVTAITARRVGNGGRYFWTRSEMIKFHTLRERIWREAILSITLAQELRGRLKEVLGEEIFWNDQVHIDVGENGLTRDFISEVVGMVRGSGFEAVIKPGSYCASVVADRYT